MDRSQQIAGQPTPGHGMSYQPPTCTTCGGQAAIQDTAAEYQRLQAAAHQLLDAADTAASRGDTVTEQRAEAAAGRLLQQAQNVQ